MTFERFDVVLVPFPFTDRETKLRRPAVVLSDEGFGAATGQCLLAMITRAQRSAWLGDTAIDDIAAAGLSTPCVVRLKLFTLVNGLIIRKLGRLGDVDAGAVVTTVRGHLGV